MKPPLLLYISILAIPASLGSDEAELRQLVEDYASSVKTLDMDLAESLWSQSAEISFIQPRGHQRGWDRIRERFYLGAMSNFSERNLSVTDLSIRLLDENAAWGEFYWTFNGVFKKNGEKIETRGRETQVWRKENGSWRIVHVHYSGMPVTGEREGF